MSEPGSLLPAWGWVDWSLLALLALSVLVGLVRGFVFECLSLVGWVVAWFAAQLAGPWLAPHLPVGTPGSALNTGVAFALAFFAVLLVWSLLTRLVRMLIHATPLSVPDRLLGAGFGLVRGLVLALVLVTLVEFTPAAQSAAWRASHGAELLRRTATALRPLLPDRRTIERAVPSAPWRPAPAASRAGSAA